MKLSQVFLKRLRDLDTNSRGKIYSHKLNEELQSAGSFASRVDQDGSALVYLVPDRSRLRVDNPNQVTDKASFYILSNVG